MSRRIPASFPGRTIAVFALAAALAVGAPAVALAASPVALAASHAASAGVAPAAVSAAANRVLPAARTLKAKKPTISGKKIATLKLTAKPGSWTSGTSFSYRWYADGKAISGATKRSLTLTSKHVGTRITVKVTGKKAGYATVSKTSAATSVVKSAKARPASKTTCPAGYPIKGNQTTRHTKDWIYHVPGGRFYKATHPEECFATEKAARQAGYRASKV